MTWRPWLAAGVGIGVACGAALWVQWWPSPSAPEPPVPVTTVVTDPVGDRRPPRSALPDVVFVIGCTIRRDQTSIHGGPATTTPTLAAMAAAGAQFDDTVAAAPWTRAASAALVTGHHPLSLGVVEPGPQRNDRVLPDSAVTLAEHLRAHGYATAGFTANPNLNAAYGFHQGFDGYGQLAKLWREDATRLPGEVAVERSLEMLDLLDSTRPRFLQVVLVDAHAPHTGSAAARRAQATDGAPESVVAYRAALRRFDDRLSQLRDGLHERGMESHNTLLVVVSDHGEGLGVPAHHGQSHGRYLAPSAVEALWLVEGPGVAAGHRIGGVASQVDVAPTVLALLGLPPLSAPGRDWSDQVRGTDDATDRQHAFSDTWFKDSNRAAAYGLDQACQVDFAGMGVPGPGDAFVSGCFDRRLDPQHARPDRDLEGQDRVRQWRAERIAESARLAGTATAVATPELDAQLEALGYVNEGETGATPEGEAGSVPEATAPP